MSIRPILGSAAALALAALAGGARAQPEEPPTVEELVVSAAPYAPHGSQIRAIGVRDDDLNLFGQPGAFALIGRIEAAARQVCAPEPDRLDLRGQSDYDRCVADATNRAVHDTGEPLVIAIHDLSVRDPAASLPRPRVTVIAER